MEKQAKSDGASWGRLLEHAAEQKNLFGKQIKQEHVTDFQKSTVLIILLIIIHKEATPDQTQKMILKHYRNKYYEYQ